MEERARISLIQFMSGKKITLDESKFEIKTAGDDIVVTLKNNPSKIVIQTRWDKVLYLRYGIFKKDHTPKQDNEA